MIDAHSPQRAAQMAEVEDVLGQIGARGIPRIEVYNKIDLDADAARIASRTMRQGRPQRVWMSAAPAPASMACCGADRAFSQRRGQGTCSLGPAGRRLRAVLFEQGAIVRENPATMGMRNWSLCGVETTSD